MKKVCNLIVIFILVLVCSGCQKNNLDLDELYDKNFELASNYFFGWGAEDYKYELIIFKPKNATKFETELCSQYFSNGVEKILYIKYERKDFDPFVVAIQYESIDLAKEAYILNRPRYIQNENIVALQMTASYMLLYGEYKQVEGYYLSPDGEALLFDSQGGRRINIVIPNGVKYIPMFSLVSDKVESIKCNSELEILHSGAFGLLPSLEKIELNDGLKEIWGNCFQYHNLDYVVIPESVDKIEADAFYNVTIYCEVNEKPFGWHNAFASNDCVIYWGGTWEYIDGVPQPIISETE